MAHPEHSNHDSNQSKTQSPFLSDASNKYASTTAAHSKWIIELLKNRELIVTDISTIWDHLDGCDDQYRCPTAFYLLSMLAHA